MLLVRFLTTLETFVNVFVSCYKSDIKTYHHRANLGLDDLLLSNFKTVQKSVFGHLTAITIDITKFQLLSLLKFFSHAHYCYVSSRLSPSPLECSKWFVSITDSFNLIDLVLLFCFKHSTHYLLYQNAITFKYVH